MFGCNYSIKLSVTGLNNNYSIKLSVTRLHLIVLSIKLQQNIFWVYLHFVIWMSMTINITLYLSKVNVIIKKSLNWVFTTIKWRVTITCRNNHFLECGTSIVILRIFVSKVNRKLIVKPDSFHFLFYGVNLDGRVI